MKTLVTGAAGFIGMHVAEALLRRGEFVVGVDNLNSYYDPQLKHDRLARLQRDARFRFECLDMADREGMQTLLANGGFGRVVHLAAQAGVRQSISDPHAYADSNLEGFLNILEGCRRAQVQRLVYASSSSVYGGSTKLPFSEDDPVDHPVSLYAATKKANELMAHAYSHLYRIPAVGLRFFTVYGPWGRPDMAYYLFTRAILEGKPIDVFNHGRMQRDFTYIDDVVEAVVQLLDRGPVVAAGAAPHEVFNVGNHEPVELAEFVATIERALGRKATICNLPMQPGDVPVTFADNRRLRDAVGFTPSTPLAAGIERFVDWYRAYRGR